MQAKNTYTRNSYRELVQSTEVREKGIYAPGEVIRVSGARFVWLCKIGQDRDVGNCFICIFRGFRVGGVGSAL